MNNSNPVIRDCAYCLAHVPDLVRYGSKPRREINAEARIDSHIGSSLRAFIGAVRYPPNQVFIGALSPDDLSEIARPWFESNVSEALPSRVGPFGEIISQDLFYAFLRQADSLRPPLVAVTDEGGELLASAAAQHTLSATDGLGGIPNSTEAEIKQEIADGSSLPMLSGDVLVGCFRADNRAEGRGDQNVSALHLLESLCTKASGALALKWLLKRAELVPDQIDYIISCGEEACGDRYQRGGGGMAKAIGEMCGCVNASGTDVKNFCAAPASALVTAGALVKAGVFARVAVVAGGSLAKLGMKFEAFLRAGIPILDDCLASMALLVTRDDGESPILHLEQGSLGLASIGSSTSDEAVYRHLIVEPLGTLGLKMTDIDKYAPELHNPEIMQFAGSGDVVEKNYRMIAAMAVMSGLIDKADMPAFIKRIGMTGFAPTQGHIPSAVPYLGHAARAMRDGRIQRVMFLCKASLFLNRITELFDGVSFVLEKNPKAS